jgi:maltooligosyltrehalose trehalohydrolase
MSNERYGANLGAHVHGAHTRFSAFTSARECALALYDEHDNERDRIALAAQGDGIFGLLLEGAGHGTLYRFVLDGRAFPDPYARFLPHGVHGPAMVVEPRYQFKHGAALGRPLREHIIYELHVGTFSREGTYLGAIERLPDLVNLGVTSVELMPVAAFAGSRGWGYDGVAHFAPHAAYGTPDELRQLVDEAHGLGLSVLLDVVYNHFGPAGNYLSSYHEAYFTRDKNAWGDSPNFQHPAVRALAIDNARYWLDEFRFDGLRLDALHAIVDPSPKHVVTALVQAVRELEPPRILIGEDERNDPMVIEDFGMDAVWADDFHHQVRVTLTGERDGYYGGYEPGIEGIAKVIERGWLYEGQVFPLSGRPRGRPLGNIGTHSLVYCIQNHDQVGNRALGERITSQTDLDTYCAISTLLLFLPSTPVLFMGQEWAASTPFLFFSDHDAELGEAISRGRREEFKHFDAFSDPASRAKIPDPQAVDTFERCRLRWDERREPEHARVLDVYRELLTLRKTDEVLTPGGFGKLRADVVSGLLRVTRFAGGDERVLLVNLGSAPLSLEPRGVAPHKKVLFSSGSKIVANRVPAHTAVILATLYVGASD